MSKSKTSIVRLDDSYGSAFMPRGQKGSYSATLISGNILLNELQLTALYVHDGIARRIVDCPAEEMTRAGFKIEDIDENLEKKVLSKLEALNINKCLNTAIKWSRAFGGSLIVLGINDGGDLETPLNEKQIIDFEFIRVYDRFEITVKSKYNDPNNVNYGNVEYWNINSKENAANSYIVHESRTIKVDGDSIPNSVRANNEGWGTSAIEKCFSQLHRFNNSQRWASLLLERLQQAIHGIPNLSDQLDEAGGEDRIKKRINVVDQVRNALNTIVIDSEETYDVKNNTVSGINELLDRFGETVSAVSSIPMFVLFGRSVGGLNSTGEANRDAWNAQVASMQNDLLRNPIDRIVSLLIRSINRGNNDGGDYKIEFNPLSVPNNKDQAEIDYKKEQTKKTKMDTEVGYINAGILDVEEIRKLIADEYEVDPMDIPEQDEPEIEQENNPITNQNQNKNINLKPSN